MLKQVYLPFAVHQPVLQSSFSCPPEVWYRYWNI